MQLTVLRENFVNRLRGSIRANLSRYESDAPWLEKFGGQPATWSLSTSIELPQPLQLELPDEGNRKDFENCMRVHKLLGILTPLQARDPRLWTRLTHIECWEYMRARWSIERFDDGNEGKRERFILERYFIPQAQSRSLLRNGLARLWWYPHLSFDAGRKNPYELTAVLLSTLDITQQLLERNLGRVPELTKGFLEFLIQNKKELLAGGDDARHKIRHLAKFLNLEGGFRLLDQITRTEVVAALEAELPKARKAVREPIA